MQKVMKVQIGFPLNKEAAKRELFAKLVFEGIEVNLAQTGIDSIVAALKRGRNVESMSCKNVDDLSDCLEQIHSLMWAMVENKINQKQITAPMIYWYPIELAPKDESVILLGMLPKGSLWESDRRVYEGRWNTLQQCFTSVNGFIVLDCATVWSPLPYAPIPVSDVEPQNAKVDQS